MDMDSDLEAAPKGGDGAPPAYDPPTRPRGSINRDVSPLPAPVPQKPVPLPRQSPEAETIFAVGEEDRDSDMSDDDGEERKGLTSGKSD